MSRSAIAVPDPPRPETCIGTEPVRTPPDLAETFGSVFKAGGLKVARDRRFGGTLVPLKFLGVESGVQSVMIEVRRSQYCDEASVSEAPASMSRAVRCSQR